MAKGVPKMTQADIDYAKKELQAWASGHRGRKLTWELVAKSTGFERQSLWSRKDIYAEYKDAKHALATGKRPPKPKSDDFYGDKVVALEKELDRYREMEQDWLERWVRIAFHARAKGLSISDLDKPLPPVARK
jgi:hypothetical protein